MEEMNEHSKEDVTELLRAWGDGNPQALEELVPLVYAELRRLSGHYLRNQRPGSSLQTTALINEAFVRLIDHDLTSWQNRAHFFGVAARTMRDIVVERARRATAQKRGGGDRDLTYNDEVFRANDRDSDKLVALDDALKSLAEVDPPLSQLVELRFFGGLTIEESAEVLGVSPATVKRSWTTAKLWLRRELHRSGSS